MSHCTSSNAARGLVSRPKSRPPHILWGMPSSHLPTPPAPHFSGFSPLSKKFLKNFSPRVPGPVRRALNRLVALSSNPKTPEFRGKTARPCLTAAPKSPAKHRPGTLKNPRLTQIHEKKLSKVHSTLLTPQLGECILEYMRLKEPRRPPHTERHAQHRPPPKISN